MEYYLCRAFEIGRLTLDQVSKLQEFEKKDRILEDYDYRTESFGRIRNKPCRCLLPFEIQQMFNLPPLKDFYGIPDEASEQAKHMQRIRDDFKKNNLGPKYDLSTLDIFTAHVFDQTVLNALQDCRLNFHYVGSKKGRRATEEVE